MAEPILTLTTDFGHLDPYVGIMKGVILGICPRARIVDLCHEITPYGITEAAFVIAQSWRYFAPGAVHVVVVDPGVGSARRPILVEAGGHKFIGPDNGVFSMILAPESRHKVRELTRSRYWLPEPGRTFHGRDVFAPAAAHLAAGVPPSKLGKPIADYLKSDAHQPVRTGKRTWCGIVLKVDRFGNLITNYHIGEFPALLSRPFELAAGAERVCRLAATFAEVEPGELAALAGSSGYIELVLQQGSAARRLGLVSGSPLELAIY